MAPRKTALPAILLLIALCSASCGTTPTTLPVLEVTPIRAVSESIPPAFLSCADEPQPPADDGDAGAGADYERALAMAGRDCRAKLGAVRGLYNQN